MMIPFTHTCGYTKDGSPDAAVFCNANHFLIPLQNTSISCSAASYGPPIFFINSFRFLTIVTEVKAKELQKQAESSPLLGLFLLRPSRCLHPFPLQVLVNFGIITAAGVLMDTFIVRPFLVPAITAILKTYAFWPGRKASNHEQPAVTSHENSQRLATWPASFHFH